MGLFGRYLLVHSNQHEKLSRLLILNVIKSYVILALEVLEMMLQLLLCFDVEHHDEVPVLDGFATLTWEEPLS